MNIIKTFLLFVNPLFKSKLFLSVVVGVGLLLWLTKGDFKKVFQVGKLLGKLGANILAIFLSLAVSPFIKMFQEAEDSHG